MALIQQQLLTPDLLVKKLKTLSEHMYILGFELLKKRTFQKNRTRFFRTKCTSCHQPTVLKHLTEPSAEQHKRQLGEQLRLNNSKQIVACFLKTVIHSINTFTPIRHDFITNHFGCNLNTTIKHEIPKNHVVIVKRCVLQQRILAPKSRCKGMRGTSAPS